MFAASNWCLASAASGRWIVWNGRRSSHPIRAPADFAASSLTQVLSHGQPQAQSADSHGLLADRCVPTGELGALAVDAPLQRADHFVASVHDIQRARSRLAAAAFRTPATIAPTMVAAPPIAPTVKALWLKPMWPLAVMLDPL